MAESRDSFKWFGEGFDGFPKILPDDSVGYTIFIINNILKDREVREKLRNVQAAATQLTRRLLEGFIWQREGFQLSLDYEATRSCLHGRTNFGDSIDDEWTIVYILRELSRQFTDIWIRVYDTDGEFLLIEAANVLPIWLNPEVADFRVWIHAGQLLVIPLKTRDGPRGSLNLQEKLGIIDAIRWIEDPDKKLLHSTRIETEAFVRLQKYPEQIHGGLHQALVNVPRSLAYVLHHLPASISPATEAFYLRDPVALKRISSKTAAELRFPPSDMTTSSVKFTKVGYAQLKSQQFQAPDSWAESMKASNTSQAPANGDIGLKLSCGFEMLMTEIANEDKKMVREINLILDEIASTDLKLPSDDDIRGWGLENDDDSWLDINFEDLEKELAGKLKTFQSHRKTGIGHESAHANLQRTVQRFEQFLSDEADAGSMNLIDDMDIDDEKSVSDDDDDTDSSCDLDHTEKPPGLREDDVTAVIREMMGTPSDRMEETMQKPVHTGATVNMDIRAHRPSTNEDSDSPLRQGELAQVMDQTEQELRDAGVLDD